MTHHNLDTKNSGRARRLSVLMATSAVGIVFAVGIPIGAAWADSPTPIAAALPVPINAGPVPDGVATDVDCPSAGHCTAAGEYEDTIGISKAMALDLTGGTWTSQQVFAPTDAPDYTFADLNSVSCWSVANCVGVGDYRVSTIQTEGFYAVETAGVWARGLRLPVPADAVANPAETTFLSVSCVPGGTSCGVLGEYTTSNSVHAVVDTYTVGTGITGSPEEISPLVGQQGIGLSAIACPDATHCVAVGAQSDEFSQEATYVNETSGVWGAPTILSNPGGGSFPGEYLSSVSCVAAGDCVAAGNWLDDNGNGFAESYTESGGVWGAAVDIGQPSDLNNPYIDDISCVATTSSCTMVGALSDNNGGLHAASAQMSNGRWGQLAPATVPAGATEDHELLGVSCATGVECTAVGYFNTNSVDGGLTAMAATWSPGVAPGPPTALQGTVTGPTSVHLAWTAPANFGTAFSHYEVTAQVPGGPVVDEGPFLSATATVTKLSPGKTYHFTVVTVASDGQVSTSALVTRTTPAEAPGAPTLSRVIGLPHELEAVWKAPKSNGGAPISSYKLTARCGSATHTVHVGGTALHGKIGGLKAGVACTVRVSASNRVGSSPSSGALVGHPQT